MLEGFLCACQTLTSTDAAMPLLHFLQVVYKRYASLFFIAAVDNTDNELITLEVR